jgi:hypothetical protein
VVGLDGVVPFAVEFIQSNLDRVHFGIGNGNPFWVGVRVEFAQDLQTRLRCRGADQIDDDLITYQRFGTPVLRDEREQPMFDFVPLTCPWRQMVNNDVDADFSG